ncbi:MAG: Extracellular ligand-binding receptor [Solirubrobacterales bacterium]|nr:Extracellular ligand-binding receptor [Solirubrobacterales bacterium]
MLVAVLVVAMAAVVVGCGSTGSSDTGSTGAGDGTKKLRIGFSGDFSGPVAPYDVPLRNGMEMAAKEINAKGGVDGITVEIVAKDNKGDQTSAVQAAQELLDDGVKVQALTTVDGMVAVGRLVTGAGGIVAGGMATTPSIVHDVGDRAFSLIFSDMAQGAVAAQHACDKGYRNAYTLEAPEFDYTKYLPAYFKDAFAKICGGKVVGTAIYKLGQTDFSAQVTKIENANPKPDVIYSGIFLPDTGPFLKRLRSAGVTAPFIGGDGNDSKFFIDSAGSAADGVVYTAHGAATKGSPLAQFATDYAKVMGKETESFTFEAVGRDTVYALVEAAKATGSVEPDKLLQGVMGLKDLPLVTGTIRSMDPKTRYPKKQVFLVEMAGGKRTFPKPIEPSYTPEPNYG